MNSHLFAQNINQINQLDSLAVLESGTVLFFPDYYCSGGEGSLLSESLLDARHKNISYDYQRNKLGAYNKKIDGLEEPLSHFMRGYAEFSWKLMQLALPSYVPHLRWGRTSYRPAQIMGRVTSKRKDDTRLHVDSFAASPVNGLRILRVFCNINPDQQARVWQVGEPIAQVLQRFAPEIKAYDPFKAKILHWLKATKSLRSAYDHYMLNLHDAMKMDDQYQADVQKTTIDFPAQSTWVVFTDQVSHAALSGQYLLEQTFYLPVNKMANPALSPLHAWKTYRPELQETAAAFT